MNVLVVDDDVATRKMLRFILEQVGGHTVEEAECSAAALSALGRGRHDVVTLDVVMPGGDGLQLCREIRRASNIPILMLSAKSAVQDRVMGLKVGADDYLSKPFDSAELLARLDALNRRVRQSALREDAYLIRIGEVKLNLVDQTAVVPERGPVSLTRTQFRLLLDLAKARGEVRTREDLETAAWGSPLRGSPNTIDSYISDLRRRLEPNQARPRYILTVRGKGYRLAC
jgi:DNA-binding response OmpR family regulator